MKRAILFFCFILSVQAVSAQKKLSELQVTLDSSKFEKVSSSSLLYIAEIQKQKGAQFKRFYDIATLRNTETRQFYRFKETGELIVVDARLHKENRENWDRTVAAMMESVAYEVYEGDRYVEHLEGQRYRAVMFFLKDYSEHSVSNHIMYKNPSKEAFLSITYISVQPDKVKIENMRKIVNGLRID